MEATSELLAHGLAELDREYTRVQRLWANPNRAPIRSWGDVNVTDSGYFIPKEMP